METHKKAVLAAVILAAVTILLTGFTGSEKVCSEDMYMDAPAVMPLLQPAMKSAVAYPKAEAGTGFTQISEGEIYLLAKIIECEARYEPYEGKVAVGSVVLNRVMSRRFPNTLEAVVFQKGQFQPVTDGGWDSKEPSEESYMAAYEVLEGRKPIGDNGQPVGNALFFIYEDLAGERASKWFKDRLEYVTTIGNHDFYGF